MKTFRAFVGIALFLLPCVAWAQTPSSEPPTPRPDDMPPGPVIIGQAQLGSPPPQSVMIQRRVIGGGGPENVTYTTMGGPGPGEGMGAWWKNSEIVGKLQLSDDQVKKISQTFLDHKLKLIDFQADVEKQELRLQPLMDADHPDEAKVGAQIDLITSARGRLEKENAMMMLAIRSQLTVDQWKKLKSLQAADEEKRKVFFFRSSPGMNPDGPPPFPGELPGGPPR
jgi:Spy/CpxP family protein refolding chaperone